ncbi:hypothetical protein MKW92_003431 [Papaver armeniacum]|nr:hypothetical protein MKW92_003431 [Papaver armeniacum]
MDDARINRSFDRLSLEVGKGRNKQQIGRGRNNYDTETWIDRYFHIVQLRVGFGKQLEYPRSQIKKQSIDLEVSLKMLFQEASFVVDDWTDVNIKFDDRRSFDRFLMLLKASGLDKYAVIKDNDISRSHRWRLPRMLLDVAIAEYYGKSLILIQFLQRISESGDDFRHEQAKLLSSFLKHLIKIQEEQQLVAYSFSKHLEQLRKFGAVSFSSNAVDDYGDKCYSKNPMVFLGWVQKHLFDSLYIMSRESAWLLEKLKDSHFTSPSSIEESAKILDIILVFISEFKKTKECLDWDLLSDRSVDAYYIEKYNKILCKFGQRIKNLQGQGVERKSVAEMLLGCFVDVVDMFYKLDMQYSCSTLQYEFPAQINENEAEFSEAALINEALEKLISVECSDLTGGGSPLGCIALWRILFESSLINLRLDLICKVEVKLLDTATNNQLGKLLKAGERVLAQFVAMQKTVAEVTYILGDAFTTGGAGMGSSSDAAHIAQHDFHDFPWDKHTVPVSDRRIGLDVTPYPKNIDAR